MPFVAGCSICKLPVRLEVNAAIEGGLSLNEISRRFGLARATVQRHSKNCLNRQQRLDAEARAEIEFKRAEMEGNLETALKVAKYVRSKAIESGDLKAILRANNQLNRVLGMMGRTIPKMKEAGTTITTSSSRYIAPGGIRFGEIEWPVGTDPELIEAFGGRVESDREKRLPADAPKIRVRIQWQDDEPSEIDRPLATDPEADPGPDELAQVDGPDSLTTEPEGEQR